MIRTMLTMLAVCTCAGAADVAAQEPPRASNAVVGNWSGRLATANVTLVFHISTAPDGKLSATMDSPDQGAAGIPTGEVTFADSTLRITVPVANAEYQGRLGANGTITGEWRQGGGALALVLTRGEPARQPKPQDPVPPLPYRVEDVTFRNAVAGIELAGTFTVPNSPGRHPAVVLITGSGPQDRDEALAGHRPFLVLADHLTRNGIAVLRYDDRGVGKSGGNFADATSPDFASDALAGVAWLKSRPTVDPRRIGLIGHSEGGLVGPLAAVQSSDVAFVVMMAGPGVSGEDILYEQGRLIARANGGNETAIEDNTAVQRRIFAAVKASPDTAVSAPRVRAILRAAIDSMTTAERTAAGITGDGSAVIEPQVMQVTSKWFHWFLLHDPAATLERVTVPVLALNGALDLQVPPQQNIPMIEAALRRANNRDVTTRVLPGLNHLFQTATTGSPTEYARIQETIAPAALELMSSWILQRFGTPRN